MSGTTGIKATGRRFLGWWLGELLGLVPRRWARTIGLGRDRLRVVVAGSQATIALEGAAGERELGTATVIAAGAGAAPPPADIVARTVDEVLGDVDAEACDALVLLAADRALRRELTIARVPDADLRRAVEREIERYTPFRADQVYLFFAVDRQKSDDRTTALAIAVAPRRFVDPVIERLVVAGVPRAAVRVGIVGIDVALATDGRPAPPAAEGAGLRLPRPIAVALAAVAIFGTTATVAPVLRLAILRAPLADRAAQTQAEAEEVRRLLGQVEKMSEGLGAIVKAKAASPSVVRVLDRITALLPDDTYLDQFNVVGREIEIEGTTRASATLVRALESIPMFEKVNYVAPVTRDPVTGAERFHFSIQFAGGGPVDSRSSLPAPPRPAIRTNP
ncbi:MAG: PilN domain-containing protein [Rhodospirillales bacterium]|nr:PilN domain-containing protein [Rhodospirillales bacterium]